MKSALLEADSSTNKAVAEQPSTVIYLAQYQYYDEPGSFWPARSFKKKADAEKYVTRQSQNSLTRIYNVIPLILEGK